MNAAFQFPTTMMFLCKDIALLSDLYLSYDDTHTCIFLDDYACAAERLKGHRSIFDKKITFFDEEGDLDADSLCQIVYDKHRFLEISTVIVEHDILSNGILICDEIKDLPIKRILIADRNSTLMAIEALNNHVIDYLIIKNDMPLIRSLDACINSASQQYFINYCSEFQINKVTNFLDDDYKNIKKQFIDEYDIAEYYQLDEFGSLLGITIYGNILWLAITDESQFLYYRDVAEHFNVDDLVVKKLLSEQFLLFLPLMQQKKMPPYVWEDYLFPVNGTFFHRHRKFFYSIISDHHFGLFVNNIFSYSQFKKNNHVFQASCLAHDPIKNSISRSKTPTPDPHPC